MMVADTQYFMADVSCSARLPVGDHGLRFDGSDGFRGGFPKGRGVRKRLKGGSGDGTEGLGCGGEGGADRGEDDCNFGIERFH